MGVVAMNFNDETLAKLEGFASVEKITVSELARQKILDWLENEEDIRDAQAILADEDDEIISHEEFWRGLKS